jgi:hypothetical protein
VNNPVYSDLKIAEFNDELEDSPFTSLHGHSLMFTLCDNAFSAMLRSGA